MSEDLFHPERISGLSAHNHSQPSVVSVGDLYSLSSEIRERAAVNCRNALFITDPYVVREQVISAKGTRVPDTYE
ncbi:hypothetical protein yc1106_05167 [Curvularia clavata]|uniref:Uncharacterized protein n=1 Tax=Curvularia clavata TaxID=95742 RepID=A0A9Q8ZBT1_CURCL|nr:hypothetical protein yc1106_05167 [Curvularia clavata]